jgi:hypothetical protein
LMIPTYFKLTKLDSLQKLICRMKTNFLIQLLMAQQISPY